MQCNLPAVFGWESKEGEKSPEAPLNLLPASAKINATVDAGYRARSLPKGEKRGWLSCYTFGMPDISGFVLAGGRSRRMGTDKAFLQLDGRTLLARALDLLHALTPEVRIVGPADQFGPHELAIEDVYAGRGPLAGIHAALSASATELNLILAVDLPFVTEPLLRFLVEQAGACDAVVTVPRIAGGYQPLCAVYRRAFAPLAQAALESGKNKIDALFAATTTRILEESELSRFAFNAAMFENLNTPEDLRRAIPEKR
jgi:molybdopterin-guanine dinucleotide biosynthesis protein A